MIFYYFCAIFQKPKKAMLNKIQDILQQVQAWAPQNAQELEALRIKYLSKKGEISALLDRKSVV